jgi:hypothetical protein
MKGRTEVCLLFLVLAACKKTPPTDSTSADASSASDAALDAPSTLAARCKATGSGLALADAASLAELEIGDAVATEAGFAVGALRKTPAGRVASIALVTSDAKSVTWVDLGPVLGDAPPPMPLARGKELYAALYARAREADAGAARTRARKGEAEARELSFVRIAEGKASPAFVVAQQRDESLAFDVVWTPGAGLIAWDEAASGGARGVVRVASIAADGKRALAPHDASPPTSDADAPRLVARKGGWWLAWIASKPEAPPDAAAGAEPEIEGPGEEKSFRWSELVALDDQGNVAGEAKRATSDSGHVVAFDLALRANGVDLDLLVYDEESSAKDERASGRIARVTVHAGSIDAPLVIVADEVGRGAPDALVTPAGATWLVYPDTHDHLRLVPLDDTRAPLTPPSSEDALDDARPIAVMSTPALPLALLAAYPKGSAAQLRVLACAR